VEDKAKQLYMKLEAVLAGIYFFSFSLMYIESFLFIIGVLKGLDETTNRFCTFLGPLKILTLSASFL